MPFEDLVSAEAQARLSVCCSHSSLEEASCSTGAPRYSHITGDVCYRRRAPLQLSSMLGFLLNERSGRFLRLTPKETDALHEILTWVRQPGSNRILEFFGTTYEALHGACGKIWSVSGTCFPRGVDVRGFVRRGANRISPTRVPWMRHSAKRPAEWSWLTPVVTP